METSQAAPDQTTNKVTNMENSEETKDVSLDELESQAKVCLSAGDYENAVQTYGQALQIAINRHGEMHASAGKFYYSYGHALLTSYENNDQMLVGESVLDAFAAQHGEEEEEGEESSEAAAANPFGLPNAPTEAATDPNNPFGLPTSNPPLQQATDPADPFGLQAQAGNQIEVEEEEEESEEGESGPSEGDAPAQAEEAGNDDLQLSWENLECARAIFLKENDVPNILKAYIRIGDLEIAREQFTAAAEEYDSALTYLDQTVPTRQLAELFYLMGLCALGKPGNETDAADYFTRSKYTLQQFLDSTELKPEEKEDIEGMIAEIQEKLEDAVEQQDSLAQIRAQEPQEENAFDAPSTAAEPKELGVLGKRKREENQDESGKQRKSE